MYSKLHQSFFTSLGIPFPANVDLCRAQIWPILTREKGPQKKVLIHSKNQALSSLPIGIKIIKDGGEDWSSKPAMEELIQHIATRLEENILRHKLLLKDQLNFEWSWQEELNMGELNVPFSPTSPPAPIPSAYRTRSTYTGKLSNQS
jgi:hypothetical protein